MRYLLCIQLLFCISIANAKNYYISSKGFDTNSGLTSATPWKSIAKINATSFRAGDSILFKRGELFYGTLTPATSGITIAAYGTGANPIITGLTTISAWTSLGGNIWEATVPGGLSSLNMVVINDNIIPMGRTPNADTENSGYSTYESTSNNNTITDNQLSGSTNWTGAELVVRSQDFVTIRTKISSHSGTTLYFPVVAGASFKKDMGYFIQNSVSTLDQNGEWYYDASGVTKKIKMYHVGIPPTIQVATLTNLVSMNYSNAAIKSNITFKGISFVGSEDNIFQVTYCNYLTIDSCELLFGGQDAINNKYTPYFTIKNSSIRSVNNMGIKDFYSTLTHDVIIKNNTIKKIALHPGLLTNKLTLYNETETGTAIQLGSPNALVQENIIDSIGYSAIRIGLRDAQIVRKNIITNFCAIKNDGGAIYSAVPTLGVTPIPNGVIIDSNIISRTADASDGTAHPGDLHSRGIYLDANSTNIKVLNNTIFDTWEGIYMSQAQKNVIYGNTIYNTGNYRPGEPASAALVINDAFDGYQHTRFNTIKNNIFFAKNADQLLYYQTDRYNGVGSIGTMDSNYFANPQNSYPTHMTNTTASSVISLFSLKTWQSSYAGYEIHGKGSPIAIPQFYYTTVGLNKAPNESFANDLAGVTASSTTKMHSLTWDNTGQITGTGSAKLTSMVSGRDFTSVYQVIGPIDNTKKYVLKFKTKGEKPGTFKTYLQQWTGTYDIITVPQSGTIGTGIEQHEVVFSGEHSTQTKAAVFLQFSQDSSTTYIDDIEFYEATVTNTNIDDFLRFEYNPTNSAKTISLNGTYMGVDSTGYSNTITLQPFTSIILLKSNKSAATLRVDAGNDISIILPANTAVLNGSASGEIKKYEWLKTDGPKQYLIENSNNPVTKISNLTMGKYTFQLKVFNSAGDSAISVVNVVLTSILPVKLSDFLGKSINEKVALQWLSESESNVDHYAIQRSSDGHTFENIGAVKSKNIYSARAIYYYDDLTPAKGINYYRLAMVDKDGTTNYSKTILVSVSYVPSFTLLNTAVSATNSYVRIGLNSNYQQLLNIAVIDVSGRVLVSLPLQIQKGFNEIYREMPSLNTGVYYIKLLTKDQSTTRAVVSDN